jgi:hypothetical protein
MYISAEKKWEWMNQKNKIRAEIVRNQILKDTIVGQDYKTKITVT